MTLLANKTQENPELHGKVTLDDGQEDLSKLLENKKTYFSKNIFPNYALIEKSNYIEKKGLNDPNIYSFASLICGGCLLLITLGKMFSSLDISGHAYKEMINALLYASTGIFSISLVRMKFFQKFTSKRWLKKEKNRKVLETEMFLDSVVDKESMKTFAKFYSEEELVNLMFEKQNLKYRDILFYIKEEQKKTALNDEKVRLKDAVKCLVEQG